MSGNARLHCQQYLPNIGYGVSNKKNIFESPWALIELPKRNIPTYSPAKSNKDQDQDQ